MPRVKVDFSDVQQFEPMPKGEYAAVISDAEYREAQEVDKYDYINLEFTVTEEGEFKDRKQWLIWSFSPKALWRMMEGLENIGLYQDELEIDYDEDTMKVTDPELVGIPCRIAVSQRPYEGRIQNQVDAVLPPGGSVPAKKTAPAGGKKTSAASRKTSTAAKSSGGRKFR